MQFVFFSRPVYLPSVASDHISRKVFSAWSASFKAFTRNNVLPPTVFASVATLGQTKYLSETYFAPDYFDYLVIDDERVIIRTKLEKPSKIKGLALI